MGKLIDLTGKKFGKLTVVKRVKNNRQGSSRWLCKCSCGTIKEINSGNLISLKIKSCGCSYPRGKKHYNYKYGVMMGGKVIRLYCIWSNMRTRCDNKNNHKYIIYGGRGIKVCNEWFIFKNFKKDMEKSYLDHVKKYGESNTTLDRKDNFKGYNKLNCRWATNREQSQNRRNNYLITYKNKTRCLSEWSRILNINLNTLTSRLSGRKYCDWTIKRAFETPARK